MGFGTGLELLEVWKIIRAQWFYSKRVVIKELLDLVLPGGWDVGYELGGQNSGGGAGGLKFGTVDVAGLAESKGRRAGSKKELCSSSTKKDEVSGGGGGLKFGTVDFAGLVESKDRPEGSKKELGSSSTKMDEFKSKFGFW
ncbi:hypothetical protein HDU76_010871 [Blyttiomyces sp. JEL0837]|nr:hypothetical protein HDU76_010871 [Blyttiomyces sp. JEL0837]